MRNNITFIYGLIDPIDNSVFYIGRTCLPLRRRLFGHLRDGRKKRTAKGIRISQIQATGCEPKIIELARLENPTYEEAWEAEQAWIDFYAIVSTLTNEKPAKCGGKGNTDGGRIDWTPELLSRLGKETDNAIAKELGCTFSAVAGKRHTLGIPAYTRWTPDILSRLGKEPDTQISADTGIPVQAILWNRRSLGIPAFKMLHNPKWIGREPPNKTKLPQWVIDSLGTMPDMRLAEQSGFTHRVISSARLRLGIPSFAEQSGNPTQFKKGDPHPRWSKVNNSNPRH